MSRTYKDRIKPLKKSKLKTKKFFGFTSGNSGGIDSEGRLNLKNGSVKIKGKDYVKYGYPADFRTVHEIKASIENKIEKELLAECQ